MALVLISPKQKYSILLHIRFIRKDETRIGLSKTFALAKALAVDAAELDGLAP